MPVFDSYHIRQELIYTNITFAIIAMFWFIVGSTKLQYTNYIISNIAGYVTFICSAIMCSLAVLYTRYKWYQVQNKLPKAKLPEKWTRFVEMHSSNFTAFMQFLARELAIENLAFTMEVVQIKHQFIARYYGGTKNSKVNEVNINL